MKRSPFERVRTDLAALIFFAVMTAAMTWPLAANLRTAVAYPGDPFVNTWILDWDWYATLHQPLRLFQANALYPARHTLAFSEHLYGIAIFSFPLRALGTAPLTTHNAMFLLGTVLTAYGAFVLTRTLTGSASAGLVSGVVLAFIPWRFTHLTHLQHQWVIWLPLMIAALVAYARSPSWPRALFFGLSFLMNGLTNLHWLVFGSVGIVVTAALMPCFAAPMRTRRAWLRLTLISLAASLLLVPFLLPYRSARQLYGMRGNAEETLRYSAEWSDWLLPNFHTRTHMALGWNDGSTDPERWLFPGFLPIALAIVGLLAVRRLRPAVAIAVLWVLLGAFGALGLNGVFHGLLFEHFELFKGIRAPARWAMLTYVGISLLAGAGTMVLLQRLDRRWRAPAAIGLAFLLAIELRAAPIRWRLVDPEPGPLYSWLARAPRGGAILELPIGKGADYEYLFRATAHHRPIANGVTDFAPAYQELVRRFHSDIVPADTVDFLRSLGITTLVVHADTLASEGEKIRTMLRRDLAAGRLSFAARFDAELAGDYVFLLGQGRRSDDDRLERFLRGDMTYNRRPFGILDEPLEGEHVRGPLRVRGWAQAPAGVAKVRIRFGNGAHRFDALHHERPDVNALLPWYTQKHDVGFHRDFDAPPDGIDGPTDVQIEIEERGGRTRRLRNVWFTWERGPGRGR